MKSFKSWLQIILGLTLFATVSYAQDAPMDKNPAPANATGSGPKTAQHSTVKHEKPAQSAGTAKSAPAEGTLTEKEKRGYALGVQVSTDIAKQGLDVDANFLLKGMVDGFSGGKMLMTPTDLNATLTAMQKEQREQMALAIKELGEKNKKDGEAFLAANKVKDGVVTMPSGLQYKVLKAGDGKKPTLDDNVVCNYRGTLIDGTEVDSSSKRKEPSIFPLKGVIKGWSEALKLMPVGSKWQVFIPADLAYGERGSPVSRLIGPNATLVFEVELVSIEAKS